MSQELFNYETLKSLITTQREVLKNSDKINLSRHFVSESHLMYATKQNVKATVYQFSVNTVDRFIDLLAHDINHLDKKIFSNLNLYENGNRIPRLQKFVGFVFSYNELVNSLLFLNYEHGFDIYKASVYVPHKIYENLKQGLVIREGVAYIHNIPVYSDDVDDPRLPENLICFTDKTQSVKVYNETLDVVIQENNVSIESYKMVVPELKANKFFTIKV